MNTGSNERTVEICKGIETGKGKKLLLIAGPCQIESLEHSLKVAEFLKKLCAKYPLNLVFKSSYDKANRTSIGGVRGPGLDAGLRVLEQVKKELDLPVLTDIHTAEQAEAAASVVDVIQTPAFLCRQTDLLIAAGKTGKTVNIKKGQFLHPADMRFSAEKVASSGNHKILLCERGTSFGYRELIVDMRGLVIMRECGYPVVFDATHSVQVMGGAGGSSGGTRSHISTLIRGAVAVGVDALFVECHEQPERAPSDGASMLPLDEMEKVIQTAIRIREAAGFQ
jgi:2-dehydro-3-deoxyphosphooctonate aldolase (KDO 8-P synthase)